MAQARDVALLQQRSNVTRAPKSHERFSDLGANPRQWQARKKGK
jgi:hypothetical protein